MDISQVSTLAPPQPAQWPTCDDLMESLEHAREVLATHDSAKLDSALTRAYSCAIELYGRLDPRRTSVCAHVQAVLEACIDRIEHAQRDADEASLIAAVRLFAPLQSVLADVID